MINYSNLSGTVIESLELQPYYLLFEADVHYKLATECINMTYQPINTN